MVIGVSIDTFLVFPFIYVFLFVSFFFFNVVTGLNACKLNHAMRYWDDLSVTQ